MNLTSECPDTLVLNEPPPRHPDQLAGDRGIIAAARELSRLSESKALLGIIRQWVVVGAAIFAWEALTPHWTVLSCIIYALAVVVIATRQHCFLALMHEGTHYRLSKNRPWNDFISDMFCAFPMGISTDLYRRAHLQHHAYTNSPDDPYWIGMQAHEDWHWPKDQVAALKLFALDFLGLAGHKLVLLFLNWSPARTLLDRGTILTNAERLRLITFVVSTATVLSIFHGWGIFFLFWVVPALTALTPMVRMRSVAEHLALESIHELNKTRHVVSNFVERQLVAPMNLNFHVAHHLYPSIPYYNLPKMHAVLMQHDTFRDHAHITSSYWGMRKGVWAEITAGKNHA